MNTITCLVARALESDCPLSNTLSLPQHIVPSATQFLVQLYLVQFSGNLNILSISKDIYAIADIDNGHKKMCRSPGSQK